MASDTSETVETPIVVKESALLPVLLTVLRYLLAAAGAWFVAKGWFTEDAINDIIGVIMIAAPTALGALLSKRDNDKLKVLEPFVPDSMAVRR